MNVTQIRNDVYVKAQHLPNDKDEGAAERQRCSETKSQVAKPSDNLAFSSDHTMFILSENIQDHFKDL